MKAVWQSCSSAGEFVKARLKKMKNQNCGVINFAGTLSFLLHFLSCLGTKPLILMCKSESWLITAAVHMYGLFESITKICLCVENDIPRLRCEETCLRCYAFVLYLCHISAAYCKILTLFKPRVTSE